MDALLDSVRLAIADGASDAERRRGAHVCRALADALDGALVPPVTAAPIDPPIASAPAPQAAPVLAAAPAPVAAAVSPVAMGPIAANPFDGLTADQILDLAIAKLRGAIGGSTPPEPVGAPFRLTLVPVPRLP